MTIEQTILSTLQDLTLDKQAQVLKYVESLKGNGVRSSGTRQLRGALSRSDRDITDDDIAEVRRAMWGERSLES